MTKESAQKHAALIRAFAAGHEIEWFRPSNLEWCLTKDPLFEAHYDYRIALPPNKSYHNPENITEEQLGKDHRFCLLEELDGRFNGMAEEYHANEVWRFESYVSNKNTTYRVPIETLFPSEPPAPKTRPFTVDDITPNMVFRRKSGKSGFYPIHNTTETGVFLFNGGNSWKTLEEDFLYSTDGKTFHPCSVNL